MRLVCSSISPARARYKRVTKVLRKKVFLAITHIAICVRRRSVSRMIFINRVLQAGGRYVELPTRRLRFEDKEVSGKFLETVSF